MTDFFITLKPHARWQRAATQAELTSLLEKRMRELPGWVEWKYYSHDGPEVAERLRAAGLEPDDEETVVVAEAAAIAPPPAEVDLREDGEAFVNLAAAARVPGRRGQ